MIPKAKVYCAEETSDLVVVYSTNKNAQVVFGDEATENFFIDPLFVQGWVIDGQLVYVGEL